MLRTRPLFAALIFAGAWACGAFAPAPARAQTQPPPVGKGPRFAIKIDSSPQQAAIYLNDRSYGIQAYTPATLKLPRGNYRLILELPGFKPREVPITVTRSQAFSVALERAARPAILDLRSATDQSALGGQIQIDGTAVGTLPNRVEVGGGRHVVEVKRPGFHDYRDNVDVAEGETRTIVVELVPQMRPGSILVTADVPDAVVYVDGTRRDTAPALVPDLPEGLHTVEVRVEGAREAPPPWKQVVSVLPGQQTKVVAQLAQPVPAGPAAGSVKVLSSAPGAEVLLDGEPKGPTGGEIKGVAPGSHIVEVRAAGYQSRRQEVQVSAGEMRVIAVDLSQETSQKPSALRVISPVPDVEVFIDGASVGKAPVDRRDLAPGKHYVVARKPGFAEFRQEVILESGQTAEIAAELRAAGSLRVLSNVTGADVFLDGTPVGRTPLTLADVGVGQHIVELKARDHLDARQTVTVEGGGQQIVNLDMRSTLKAPTVADVERLQREQSSWGAITLERGRFNVDVGAGYPYFLEARLITGLFKIGQIGLDLGVDLRTNFFFTDVGLRPRLQILRFDPFALGVDLAILGGGGPTKRNSFTFEVGPIATLIAGQYVHVNFRPYLIVASDRLCPSVSQIQEDDAQSGDRDPTTKQPIPGTGSLYKDEVIHQSQCRQIYSDPNQPVMRTNKYLDGKDQTNPPPSPFGQPDPRERFVNTRFMLQASVEIAVTRTLNLWALIEGAPFQGQRFTYTEQFVSWFPKTDFPLYGRLGLTGKF